MSIGTQHIFLYVNSCIDCYCACYIHMSCMVYMCLSFLSYIVYVHVCLCMCIYMCVCVYRYIHTWRETDLLEDISLHAYKDRQIPTSIMWVCKLKTFESCQWCSRVNPRPGKAGELRLQVQCKYQRVQDPGPADPHLKAGNSPSSSWNNQLPQCY